jgi:hypothetical protein
MEIARRACWTLNQLFVTTFRLRHPGYDTVDGALRPLSPQYPCIGGTRELQMSHGRTTTYSQLCGDTIVPTLLDTAWHWH